ncbi:hypothetical protein [Streptomyces spectabilis]|uniref:DUF8175 domain-containing protein n=1 Tax=Streptomyces spectabilis TaxID=68270 RepID=A0A7W8AYT4_STRST|nr:hypothetical protein [Streptomyces spectabilis]MBB5106521.1 hypothetical protein [Streptomyces spectabilis]GGV47856.1 hypothetical protein GCM10010245_75140 [Streptomyces spectabilis]
MSDDDDLFGGTGETRTRLPERDGADGYGAGRRSGRRSSSRSLVTVIGVVVLLIAAIAFANRDDSSSDDGGDTNGNKDTQAAPTAPTGEKPVSGKNGGIPAGYAKTEQGAQSAAANYAVALGSAEMFDKSKRDGILKAIMAPSSVPKFKADLDKAYSADFFKNVGLNANGSTPSGYQFVSRTSPIGTRVTAFADGKATVATWCGGLLGLAGERSTKPVTSSWFTITMKLTWTDGDWKITTHTQKDGPAPVPGDDRASGSEEIADAVEGYGGFTYAR